MTERPGLDGTSADEARCVEWYAPDRPVNGTAFIRPDDERPDLDDRDPATLTDLEKLAFTYPEVAELVRERDALSTLLHLSARKTVFFRGMWRATGARSLERRRELERLRAIERSEVRALVHQAQNAVWNGTDQAHAALGDVTDRIMRLFLGEA